MRKNPISNVSLLFGPGRTFGKANILHVPPVVVPRSQSPRTVAPGGNVHDPFGALAPRKPGSETPPGVQILAQGDHIMFARVLFDATNKMRQITVPFDLKSARVYGVAGGAHLFTSTGPKSELDQFGVPLDQSFIGTGLPGNDTIIPIPSIGAREVTLMSAFDSPPAFTGAQQQDGPLHLYLLNDGPDGVILDVGSYPQNATPEATGIQFQQPSLISTALEESSMHFDGVTGGVKLPFYEVNGGGSFSVELLCKLDKTALAAQSLVANGSPYNATTGKNQGFELAADTNTSQWLLQLGCSNSGPLTAAYNAVISLDTVYHVCATVDVVNQVAYVYVNGQATGKLTGFGSYITGIKLITLAENLIDASQVFTGYMQNVALYNYALTGPQIQAHYNALSGSPAPAIPQELLLWLTDDIWSPSTTQITLPTTPRAVVNTQPPAPKPLTKTLATGAASTQVSTTPGQLISVLVTALAAAPAAMTITDGNGGATVGIIPANATVNGVPFVFNMPVQNGVYVVGGAGNPAVTICFE